MLEMRWTTYVLTLFAAAILVVLLVQTGSLPQANAQVTQPPRGRLSAPALSEPAGRGTVPVYVVEEYTDVARLQTALNSRAQQGYHVVAIQAVPTRIGNPENETYRISYRNTLDVYPTWVAVYTR